MIALIRFIHTKGWAGPTKDELRDLFDIPDPDWKVFLGGVREPVAIALPPGWGIERLSARETMKACQAGLPVLPDSVHDRWKVVQRQGLVARDPDWNPWRPPEVPLIIWDAWNRRWRDAAENRNPLVCGEAAPEELA